MALRGVVGMGPLPPASPCAEKVVVVVVVVVVGRAGGGQGFTCLLLF